QGCAVSIAYAVRHPARVERMILYGGYAQGWRVRGEPAEIAAREAMRTLVREGWGQENPAFRQLFTSRYIPGGTPEQMQWFNDLQRIATPPATAAQLIDALGDIDVTALVPRLRVPTLVVHSRHDAGVPFAQGELLARTIPGARFVALESRNPVVLEHAPAWPKLAAALREVLPAPALPPAAAPKAASAASRAAGSAI